MLGRLTTRIPPSMELVRLMQATVPMIMLARHFEIEGMLAFVRDAFSSPCRGNSMFL